jgi:diguanylate cyclase (GGDEF)-like protein/PAS domain S-box-containing protein
VTTDNSAINGVLRRFRAPALVVTLFVIAMSGCVVGLVVWKAVGARNATLVRSEADIQNLAHSLAEHAGHTIQAADVAMSGMVELLKYQRPLPERFNLYLASTVRALPQLREIGVLDEAGDWKYASLNATPTYNNADRAYFLFHRDHPDLGVRISEPLQSRLTGRPTIILSKRISRQDGSFSGVLTAAIDTDYFNSFYSTFQLGQAGGISLIRGDGIALLRWPFLDGGRDLSQSELFQTRLKESSRGYYKITSPFDGKTKYFGYEQVSRYPLILTVALSETELLQSWNAGLVSDAVVAFGLLCTVVLLALLVTSQFGHRMKVEKVLREREQRYRLLADNIADIVILLDQRGTLSFVSQSVQAVLGLLPDDLVGRSYFDLVHIADIEIVKRAIAQLTGPLATSTVVLRMLRADQSLAWVEIHFKRAASHDSKTIEIVGVLRDVTQRKLMEEELTSLNARLAQLATTDGLTGLANRRTLDGFLRRLYAETDHLSVLLFDIDHFKGYNDSLGHQAGDQCLKRVAKVIADATLGTKALSARYGGEEFAVVLPGVSELDASKVAEAIRLTIRSLGIPNPASTRGLISVSVGIAGKTQATLDETALVRDADLALYEAKRSGRNRSVVSSDLLYVKENAATLAPGEW